MWRACVVKPAALCVAPETDPLPDDCIVEAEVPRSTRSTRRPPKRGITSGGEEEGNNTKKNKGNNKKKNKGATQGSRP